MMRIIKVVLVLVAWTFSFLSHANPSPTLSSDAFNWKDSLQRKKVATELRPLFKRLAKAIPKARPSEAEWVEQERHEGKDSLTRLNKLLQTREFAQVQLHKLLGQLEHLFEALEETRPLGAEIVVWMGISMQIYTLESGGFDDRMAVLDHEGYFSKDDWQEFYWIGSGTLLKSLARDIQFKIVVPYREEGQNVRISQPELKDK